MADGDTIDNTGKTQAALPVLSYVLNVITNKQLPEATHFRVLAHAHLMLIFDACASSRYQALIRAWLRG